MKIGLFGGSFDPPHLGHLTIAQDAYESLELDSVWFIPNYLSPLKSNFHVRPDERLRMIELMIEQDDRFECLADEVDAGTSQYTIDTVQTLISRFPEYDFYWLIGADQLDSLHKWKSFKLLKTLLKFVVFKRPGYSIEGHSIIQEQSILQVDFHEVLISSSEIRERIQKQLPVYMFLHPAVNKHIESKQFYIN